LGFDAELAMILIAGAGIGGLTLGCALARAGRPFRIFERAVELRPVGAGIALSDNAFRALAYIDLADGVRACGQELRIAAICDPHGGVITEMHMQDVVAGATVAMPRAALQDTLLAALGSPVETGREVAGYESRGHAVRVRFADGSLEDGELLVGADGLRSVVRQTMCGPEPLRYAGYTTWRALVDDIPLHDPHRFTETWGAGERFGVVPMGPRRVYWFAVADEAAGRRDEGDPRPALLARFGAWHRPIAQVIEATPRDRIVRTDVFDRPPITRWADDRTVLLGDAAHPMTPNMGMGGCQAIEDAVVLSSALAREPDIESAIALYQRRRIARANSFVVRSFRLGQIAQLRSRPLRWLRDRAIAAVPVSVAARAVARDMDFRL
jgi:2-polyprenyl-6-methoxyphenol hydroxylase-like FAD-dependent oxidoreductase